MFFRKFVYLNLVKEKLGRRGWLEASVKKKGETEFKRIWAKPVPNLIVDAGVAWAAYRLGSDTPGEMSHGAVGTGTNAPAAGNTALQTEVDRQAASFSRETTSKTNDTAKWVTTHTAPAGGWAITEYGLFNAAAAGDMYNRVTFSAINLPEGDQLQMTYKSQITLA